MKESFKENSSTLFTRKSSFIPDINSDKYDNAGFEEEYNVKLYTSVAMIVMRFEKFDNKNFGGTRKFHAKSSSSISNRSDVGNSKKDEGKCFDCGGADHFARDCKVKKNNQKEESYETKYKRLVASLKRKNLESKVLVVEGEEWVDEEELSDEEVKKSVCLMGVTGDLVTDEASSSSSTFDVDLAKAASDSKVQNWDSSSLYQVKKLVTYSEIGKSTMFEYSHLDLSKSNQEIHNLINEIESLKSELSNSEKSLS
ncbi:unnamed protein product [Lactuca virosa]|uniref:CCHC-type domain-containing protein n=1 Tax=Lactuca virosa TaxID=75947 RepID=A0AAU9MEN5_9ASTR|nr:unnamed protein product [Lactuca virosa]